MGCLISKYAVPIVPYPITITKLVKTTKHRPVLEIEMTVFESPDEYGFYNIPLD